VVLTREQAWQDFCFVTLYAYRLHHLVLNEQSKKYPQWKDVERDKPLQLVLGKPSTLIKMSDIGELFCKCPRLMFPTNHSRLPQKGVLYDFAIHVRSFGVDLFNDYGWLLQLTPNHEQHSTHVILAYERGELPWLSSSSSSSSSPSSSLSSSSLSLSSSTLTLRGDELQEEEEEAVKLNNNFTTSTEDADNELIPSNIQLLGKPIFKERHYMGFFFNGTVYKVSDCCLLTKKLKPGETVNKKLPQDGKKKKKSLEEQNNINNNYNYVVCSDDDDEENSRREEEEEETEYDNAIVQIRSVRLKEKFELPSEGQEQQVTSTSRVVIEIRMFAWPHELVSGPRVYHNSNKTVLQVTPQIIRNIGLESNRHDISLKACQVLPLAKYCKLGY